MPYAPVRDLQIYHELHGPADGPPLALLAGGMDILGPGGFWYSYIDAFSAAGYRVLTYDARGHGRTDNPPARFKDYDELADDAIALFDYLGFTRPHIAGWSDGGVTALSLGMRYPQHLQTLVLIATRYHNDETTLKAFEKWEPNLFRVQSPALVATWDKAMPDKWEDLLVQRVPMWLSNPNFSPAQMSRVITPTLVMAGDRDYGIALDQTLEIYKAISRSELCILPDTGHAVFRDSPEISKTIMLDFLKRHGDN